MGCRLEYFGFPCTTAVDRRPEFGWVFPATTTKKKKKKKKKNYPRSESNRQSSDPESDALSIRPRGQGYPGNGSTSGTRIEMLCVGSGQPPITHRVPAPRASTRSHASLDSSFAISMWSDIVPIHPTGQRSVAPSTALATRRAPSRGQAHTQAGTCTFQPILPAFRPAPSTPAKVFWAVWARASLRPWPSARRTTRRRGPSKSPRSPRRSRSRRRKRPAAWWTRRSPSPAKR